MSVEVFLAHGASGNATSMAPWVDGLRQHGIRARAIDLPRRRAEEAVPAFLRAVTDRRDVVLGGHSFGGRVASLTVAGLVGKGGGVSGLLLLSYPLHPPGRPEAWQERTAHWATIPCPVLLLSGEADPFARLPLLREAVKLLPQASLVTYPRVGHGLLPVLDEALSVAAAFIDTLEGGVGASTG